MYAKRKIRVFFNLVPLFEFKHGLPNVKSMWMGLFLLNFSLSLRCRLIAINLLSMRTNRIALKCFVEQASLHRTRLKRTVVFWHVSSVCFISIESCENKPKNYFLFHANFMSLIVDCWSFATSNNSMQVKDNELCCNRVMSEIWTKSIRCLWNGSNLCKAINYRLDAI